jgi:hypothetical protein
MLIKGVVWISSLLGDPTHMWRLVHPHIPIPELQRVAKEVCRIIPMVVTQELFLFESTTQQDQGSREGLQFVVYGSM